MKTIKAILFALFILIASAPCWSYDQSDLDILLSTGSCPNGDLSGANLSGVDLHYAILTGAYLEGADLSNADLSNANFTDAIISNTTFTDAYYAEGLPPMDLDEEFMNQLTINNGSSVFPPDTPVNDWMMFP